MVSTPFSPPQMVVSLYRSDCSYFCLSGLACYAPVLCQFLLSLFLPARPVVVMCMLGKNLLLV